VAAVLYRPEAFEPLIDEQWDVERVRAGIRAIVADADAAFDPDGLWPVVNGWDDAWRGVRLPLTVLYSGASGAIWALDVLARRGHAEPEFDRKAAALRALEEWRRGPDMPERREPPVHTHASLFYGETGPLVVAYRLARSNEIADALHGRGA
jgi:hypothetical protein